MRTMRTVGLIILACFLTGLVVLVWLIAWLGPVPGIVLAIAAAAVVSGAYFSTIGPWQRRWGATDLEVERSMPGDELLRPDTPSTTRAITIDAPPEDVFPWLLQIGYGRGGWYSYDWIDNDGKPSVDRIDPSLQGLTVGDRIEMMPGLGPVVREIERNHYIVSGGETDSWCLMVEPATEGRTRLVSRWRQDWPKTIGTRVWIAIVDPGAFLMEQKMLRTIRDRVTSASHRDVRLHPEAPAPGLRHPLARWAFSDRSPARDGVRARGPRAPCGRRSRAPRSDRVTGPHRARCAPPLNASNPG
jgi:hypothetical protein